MKEFEHVPVSLKRLTDALFFKDKVSVKNVPSTWLGSGGGCLKFAKNNPWLLLVTVLQAARACSFPYVAYLRLSLFNLDFCGRGWTWTFPSGGQVNFLELILYHVGAGSWTWVFRLGGKCLKLLSLAHCSPFFPCSLHSRRQNRNRL